MKKVLMLSLLTLMFTSASVFAACPCKMKKVSCDPCQKPKVTCCEPACPDQSFQGQCCHKKSFLKKLWGGTKTAYDASFGAIYDTIMVPFR